MMALGFLAPIVLLGAQAQVAQDETFETLELRVTAVRPRQAVVDRGTVDGLALKDRVTFRPRTGRVYGGIVTEIGERVAVVDLDDPSIVPALGTKGDARVPRARRPPPAIPPAIPPVGDEAAPAAPAAQEHPPWERKEDEWKSGDALLAHVRPFRPDEREPNVSGRAYSIFDFAHSSEGDHSDTFARTGASLLFENPFRRGGELHVDVEANYRNTDVPDADGEELTRLRLDRLSYSWGGNRFTPDRYEIGRFLQHEMPEFGVLDGGQWSHRLPGGNSFGASVGFIPDQVLEQNTGDDLQFAGYYRWVADESEQLSLAAGYQKTFHYLDADRDLLVGKIVYLPGHDWDFTGTAWVDLYTAGDEAKGRGLGLTQAYLSTGKHWDGGSTVRFTYTHLEFPENELDAFTPVTFDQLAHDHADRVAATTRQAVGRHFGVFAQGGAWADQDDAGGDGEVGLDFEDVAFEGSTVELAGFYTGGRFSTTVGGRTAISGTTSTGAWHLAYEFTYDDIVGFDSDNNSLPQHRARASWDFNTNSRWSLSMYAEALLFDQETSVLAGLFLQRSF